MLHDTMLDVTQLMERADVRAANEYIAATDRQTLVHQIDLTEIPAPPFGEEARGRRMAELLGAAGLSNVQQDSVGNVLALRPGAEDRGPLVLSAHLDTVFPAGTDVTVRAEGDLCGLPASRTTGGDSPPSSRSLGRCRKQASQPGLRSCSPPP